MAGSSLNSRGIGSTWNKARHGELSSSAHIAAFGKRTLTANGVEVLRWRCFKRNDAVDVVLPGSRQRAVLTVRREYGGPFVVDLRIDGRLMVPSEDLVKCQGCGTTPKPYDTFCGNCGRALAAAEDYDHIRRLKWARNTIKYLGILYAVIGVLLFFVTKRPGVLVINLILGAVMGVLFLWSKTAPLAAILVASATYLVVITTGALLDPRTLAQGIYLKIIIVFALAKGVKSALALRSHA